MTRLRLCAPLLYILIGSFISAPGLGQPSTLSSEKGNVILITIDTLRADYLGCYGKKGIETPVLDRLASEGALFETVYCQVPLTPPSHASIMTGLYPQNHGLRDFTAGSVNPGLPTIATILRSQGYRTAAFVSAFVLDRSWGLNEGFEVYADDFDLKDFEGVNPGNVQRIASDTIDRVLNWLPSAGTPFFLWVHLFDPHDDYNPPEPFKTVYANDLYAGEVAYTDSQLGRLIAALKKQGSYDSSLIIATSDHGESLGEHGEEKHGFFLYDATVRVPLIMKMPASLGVSGIRVNVPSQTVDILPTVLQVLRLPADAGWRFDGRGVLAAVLGKPVASRPLYAETVYPETTFGWSPLKALREGSLKYIEAPRAELYDLTADPRELSDLASASRSIANSMKGRLARLESTFGSSRESVADELDPEKVERLSALGYVSLGRPIAADRQTDARDPKDMIGVFNRIMEALEAAEAGAVERSNSILEDVVKGNPQMFIVHYTIGKNALKLRNPGRALEALERATTLNPDYTAAQVTRASALSMLGRIDEAIALLREVIDRNDIDLTARRELALLLGRTQKFDEAIRIYREILEERASDQQALKFLGIALVQNQQYEEGLQVIDQTVSLGVDDALIRNFQGIALDNTGQGVKALASFQRALELKGDYAEARLNYAFALKRQGLESEARAEFEKLCTSSPALCRRYQSHFLQ